MSLLRIDRQFLRQVGLFLFWSLAFGIAFTQWPLFSENQNTKFLIGLANANFGYLPNDWLANTIDPLPVFSGLVYLTYRFLNQNVYYLYHVLLLGLYLWGLGAIASHVFPLQKTPLGIPLFYTIIIALHSGLLPPFSNEVMGTSLGWLLQAGVANQYLFNPVLQPSTFGVLLIFSIYLFLQDHPRWAAASAATAAIFHSTYLPSAAVLVLGYAFVALWQERSIVQALIVGLIALAMVAPILLYNAVALGPTNADLWAQSQDIIVNFRIPHHSIPEVWLNDTVYVKLGIVALALLLVIRTRLFVILLISALVAVGLTMLQMRVNWDTLGFIAPWRISVFLVPLATSLIIAFVVAMVLWPIAQFVTRYKLVLLGVCLALLIVVVGRGALAVRASFAARANADTAKLWQFAKDIKQPDHVYLVPTHMAEFRLATGVPVVITFKSHPYKDTEVIEWRSRVDAVNGYYNQPNCEGLPDMVSRYGVTHVVLLREQFFDGCDIITNVHLDDRYGVFQIEY